MSVPGRTTSVWDLKAPLAARARHGSADKLFLGGQWKSLESWLLASALTRALQFLLLGTGLNSGQSIGLICLIVHTLMTLGLSSLEKFDMSSVLSYDASNTFCLHTLLLLRVPRYYCCCLDQTYVRHTLTPSPLL